MPINIKKDTANGNVGIVARICPNYNYPGNL
jgi:hypothetical protein